MGASLGLALGSAESKDEQCEKFDDCQHKEGYIPGPFDVIKEYSQEEMAEKLRSSFHDSRVEAEEMKEKLRSEFYDLYLEEAREEEDDDIEVIDSTPYLNEEGVMVKNTTEGLVEVVEPYVISEDEFVWPAKFGEFDRNTLIYYEKDDVLTTDRDEVITDVEKLIGPSALTSFGNKSGHRDVVYIRNIKLGADYEVLREYGSYKEKVLGLSDEDEEYEKAKKFFKQMEDE